MPTYDYECDGCGHTFELFQGISEEVMRKCPECKKNKLRRLFGTGAAIMFKGSGFYETDYRSESYKQGAEKAKKATEGNSDSKKSDSKSADSKSTDAKSADKASKSDSSSSSDKSSGSSTSSKPSKKKDS